MQSPEELLQLNEFFIEGGNQQKSHVLLHLTEPSTPEEKAKGFFFAVAEINNSETKYIAKLQEYIDEIENGYYEMPDQEEKNSLELVLEKINQKSYSLIKPEVELHCVVGAIRQPEIILSFAGNPHTILFYKNKQSLYQQMNLVSQTDEQTPIERPQLFSQIIIGKISADDYLFAGTPHLTNYFSYDRLQKIITTRPARQSADHLERVLGELHDGISFGGLIIHVSKTAESKRPTFKKALAAPPINSTRSLYHLYNTEQNTANTLSVSLLPQIKNKLKNIFKSSSINTLPLPPLASAPKQTAEVATEINAAHLRAHRAAPPQFKPYNVPLAAKKAALSTAQVIILLIKYLIKWLWWFILTIWHILVGILNLLGMLFIVITNLKGRRKYILDDWRRGWYSYKENFKQLSTFTKFLLLGALVLTVIFVISVFYLKHQQTTMALNKQLQDTINLINIKKEAANNMLNFNDETKALIELQSAQAALQTLPCNTSDNKILCAKLSDSLNSLTIKLRKIIAGKPVLLTEWKNLIAPNNIIGLVRLSTKLIALPATAINIFNFDLLTKEQKIVATNNKNLTLTFLAVPKENDYILLGAANSELYQLNPVDYTIKKADVSFPAKLIELKTAVVYNRRLYSLDTLNNQIYKHDSIKSGFGPGKPWLKDASANVKDGVDITIDGDIYVLNKNGSIIRIIKGTLDPAFVVSGLEPALNNAGKIWTYNDLQYLYVLNPAQKRLIILNKDGKLKNQITFDDLASPADFAIDEPNHVAYLIDGAKLYKIDLP